MEPSVIGSEDVGQGWLGVKFLTGPSVVLCPSQPYSLLEEGVQLAFNVGKGVVAQVVHLARLPALLPLLGGDGPQGSHISGGGGRCGRGGQRSATDALVLPEIILHYQVGAQKMFYVVFPPTHTKIICASS